MKTRFYISLLILICTLPLSAESKKSDKTKGGPPPSRQEGGEARMLQHFLEMDPEELTRLRQTIERIERMSPEEKQALQERINQLDKMKPERVSAMKERFKAIPKEKRDAMRQRWIEMSPEERKEWRQKLQSMTHEERADLFEAEGFMPSMGKPSRAGKGPPAEPKN